jgi:hypothetical protein
MPMFGSKAVRSSVELCPAERGIHSGKEDEEFGSIRTAAVRCGAHSLANRAAWSDPAFDRFGQRKRSGKVVQQRSRRERYRRCTSEQYPSQRTHGQIAQP